MKLPALAIACLLGGLPLFAQHATSVLYPSAYYTTGSYSNGAKTSSIAGYAAVSLGGLDHVIAGYDKMTIDSPPWTYDQQMFVVGGRKNFYPFYLKLNYGQIQGTFKLPVARYSYQDHLYILNGGVQYNIDLFFIGVTHTYAIVRGYKRLECHQTGLSGDWMIDPALSLSVSPLYTSMTDGRSFGSLSGGISYSPWQPLLLQVSGMIGKRAYYFNPDLLTIFSQDETQERLWGIRAEYVVEKAVTLIGSYQSTDFSTYTVKYLSLGARFRFDL
jgi:hypothetical protein